jgi:hypothetical protein
VTRVAFLFAAFAAWAAFSVFAITYHAGHRRPAYPSGRQADGVVAAYVDGRARASAVVSIACVPTNRAGTVRVPAPAGTYGCLMLLQESGQQACAVAVVRIDLARRVTAMRGSLVAAGDCRAAR